MCISSAATEIGAPHRALARVDKRTCRAGSAANYYAAVPTLGPSLFLILSRRMTSSEKNIERTRPPASIAEFHNAPSDRGCDRLHGEIGRGMPGSLNNALDWTVSSHVIIESMRGERPTTGE